MMAINLALRNLIGAGLRTWLNVFVLSFSFVIIIWHHGILDGWDRQARNDMIRWEIGGGQYWQQSYDPYDPLSLTDAHAPVPAQLTTLVNSKKLTPVLITQGSVYPGGRMQNVLIKGIDPSQQILNIPTCKLDTTLPQVPAVIGTGMASASKLKAGDVATIRWRDKNGAFDATEILITGIFQTNVPSVDLAQLWIPLNRLQKMLLLPEEASLLVCNRDMKDMPAIEGWKFQSTTSLLADIDQIMKSKSMAGKIMWAMLLMLAMLAIFDTQVLSIFRRQKEIGTYIAMGMTRNQVVGLFTVEGAMHAVLAALVGAFYGIPLLWWQSVKGLTLPMKGSDYGITMAQTLYPEYGLGLITSTILIVLITTTIVSYWPARTIAKMKPTDALRGKIQ